MKKKLLLLTIIFSAITVFALSRSFSIDTSTLSFTNASKKDDIKNTFKKEYNLTYSIEEEDSEEKEELKKLAKRTTYLLFGDFNNYNESSVHFYNREKELYDLIYNPKLPEEPKDSNEVDKYEVERRYATIASWAVPQIFDVATEAGLIYNSFGNISVGFNDGVAICIVDLPNIKIKEESPTDPMKYEYNIYNYKMYYAYYKQDDEWKLWYVLGEDSDDMEEYADSTSSMESKQMAIAESRESLLNGVYNFDKIKDLDKEIINAIYEKNKNSIVYINGIYNNSVVSTGNGFFISDGLLVTTWSFLQKSLVNAQYIAIVNSEKIYDIKGIVTVNPEADIAVLKVDNNDSHVELGDITTLKIEDPAIIISSKYGTGLVVQTGIITNNEDYLQTSIPLMESDAGSPLFNRYGEVVGINTSQSVNSNVSNAVNVKALKEVYDKFKSIEYDKLEVVTFDELKDKYFYVKIDDENIKNSIPEKKWEEYSKIGDVKNTIKLDLVKASYKNGTVSLRYKNTLSRFMSSMQLSTSFKKQLQSDGYKEVLNSKTKAIYRNDQYQVVIMDEFDYLIVVMVAL